MLLETQMQKSTKLFSLEKPALKKWSRAKIGFIFYGLGINDDCSFGCKIQMLILMKKMSKSWMNWLIQQTLLQVEPQDLHLDLILLLSFRVFLQEIIIKDRNLHDNLTITCKLSLNRWDKYFNKNQCPHFQISSLKKTFQNCFKMKK